MKRLRIFYSWQSDLPNKFNRGFIASVLEKVSKEINKSDQIGIQAIIDRDTKDTSGAPNIVNTIFSKIDECDIFIADISIINLHEENTSRRVPNPNVLVELGYAAAKLGWDNVILLYNLDYGRIEDIPFDLSQRRPIFYKLSVDSNNHKVQIRDLLRSQIFASIIQIFNTDLEKGNTEVKVLYPYLHNGIYLIYNSLENLLDRMYNYFGDIYKSTDIYNADINSVLEILNDLEKEFEKRQLRRIDSIKRRVTEIINAPNAGIDSSEEDEQEDEWLFSDTNGEHFKEIVKQTREYIIDKVREIIQYQNLLPSDLIKGLYSVLSIYSNKDKPVEFQEYTHLWYDEFQDRNYLSQIKFNREVFLDLMFTLKDVRSVFLDAFSLERESYRKSRAERYLYLRKIIEKE